MFIFSKAKPLVVDFVTSDYKAYEYFSIDRSNKFIPQWWKEIPQEYNNDIFKTKGNRLNTLKRCPGFMDIFRYSYTMPLWTSCEIIVNNQINDLGYSATCADNTEITSHPSSQSGKFMECNSLTHLKFHSPWYGYSSKGRDLLWNWSPATWNNPLLLNTLMIPTAFRNFRGGTSTTIHSFINSKENNTFYLEAGVPMIHMTPMTDKKVNVKCHYDPDWYHKIKSCTPSNFSSNSSYYTRKKFM